VPASAVPVARFGAAAAIHGTIHGVRRVLWLVCALFIVYGTTIPFRFNPDRAAVTQKASSVRWNPLLRQDGRRVSIPDSVQNVMLFVPFGVLGVVATRHRWRTASRCVVFVTVSGAALSAGVEILQLFTVDRISSTADVLTNTLGTLVGAGMTTQVAGWWRRRFGSVDVWTVAGPMGYPLMVAAVVVMLFAWQPFDFTLDVGVVVAKARLLLKDPWQLGPWTDEVTAVMIYALAAMALRGWLKHLAVCQASLLTLGLGVMIAVGLELSQLFVTSRMPSAWDALVRVLGVLVGVRLSFPVAAAARPKTWLAVLGAVTLVAALVEAAAPVPPSVPEQALAVGRLVDGVLVYLPFGFCVAWYGRWRGMAVASGITVVMAGLAQSISRVVFHPHGDVTSVMMTSVMIACAGSIAGALAAMRAPSTSRMS
jgi:VanZ family protein